MSILVPRRPAIAVAALAVVLALLVGACSSDSTSAATEPTSSSASPATGIDWADCGEGLQCATVAVPLDWADPGGETIDLAVIKHPAINPDQRIGTVLANPGGPGDTGVGLIRSSKDDFDEWGEGRFDWVSWDPRGTNASEPVHCFETEAESNAFWDGATIPSTTAEAEAYTARVTDLAKRCGEVMGPLLSHISTKDTVRDMDHIRELIGEDKITYVGLSYGTVIGQVYANMFPEHLRAMMLDGVVDPVAYTTDAETRAANGTVSVEEVFEQFQTTCETAGPERCALAGHGESVAQRVAALLARLKQAPIPIPGTDPVQEFVYSDLQLASYPQIRNPGLWPKWAEMLEATIGGDPTELADLAAQSKLSTGFVEATKSSAISCLDGPASEPLSAWPTVIGNNTGLNPFSGALTAWWLWAPCAADWPATSDDRFTGPWDTVTETPILLIGTRHDPSTAYQNAVRSQHLLGNAVLLTHDGYGHLSPTDPSQCTEAARTRYLVDLETPPPGTVCKADKAPFF